MSGYESSGVGRRHCVSVAAAVGATLLLALYVMNRDGTGIRRLTDPHSIDGSAAWRPASA